MTDPDSLPLSALDVSDTLHNLPGESTIDMDKVSNYVSYQGFIRQNLAFFRSRMRLSLILGWILGCALFCLIFVSINARYLGKPGIDPTSIVLSNFTATDIAGDPTHKTYSVKLKIGKKINTPVIIYFEHLNFLQSYSGLAVTRDNIESKELDVVLKTMYARSYPYLDNVQIVSTSNPTVPIEIKIPEEEEEIKFGRKNITLPPQPFVAGDKRPEYFPKEWGTIKYDKDNEINFNKQHYVRFCQWLSPSPFKVATKIIGTFDKKLEVNEEYILSIQAPNNPSKLENIKIYVEPLPFAITKPELEVYLMTLMVISFITVGFLLLMRYLFPQPQQERDIACYRKKLRINI